MVRSKKVKDIKELLKSEEWLESKAKSAKYISHEYQSFGLKLANELNDLEHKSLYIRLDKNEKRIILERALSFVSDYHNAKAKGKVFMWKLKELREEYKQIEKEEKSKQLDLFNKNSK